MPSKSGLYWLVLASLILPFAVVVWLVFIWAGLLLKFDTRPAWHGLKWTPRAA